jgi:WW domain
MDSAAYLDSLLDNIDRKKKKSAAIETTESTAVTSAGSTTGNESLVDPIALYQWSKYFDSNTNKFYYYNLKTKVTQWEKPPTFEDIVEAPVKCHASFSSTSSSFNIAGEETYFDKVGRPNDREGRQMSAFFDLDSFDKNREEAAKLKLLRQQGKDKAMKNIDWSKVKDDKKRKRNLKLLSDV